MRKLGFHYANVIILLIIISFFCVGAVNAEEAQLTLTKDGRLSHPKIRGSVMKLIQPKIEVTETEDVTKTIEKKVQKKEAPVVSSLAAGFDLKQSSASPTDFETETITTTETIVTGYEVKDQDSESVERIKVIIKVAEGQMLEESLLAECDAYIDGNYKNLYDVYIPPVNILKLVDESNAIFLIRHPLIPVPLAETSEGVALTAATTYQGNGYTGSGVDVAVIDLGYSNLDDAVLNGDIPSNYKGDDETGGGLKAGTETHGTGCAEIVYDMAPDAQLHLILIASATDLGDAIDYCIANGVDIISHSVGWFDVDGRGDGSGTIGDIVDDAYAAGILWVNAAGNYTQSHWQGTFTQTVAGGVSTTFLPGSTVRFHEFSSGNQISHVQTVTTTGAASRFALRWNDGWSTVNSTGSSNVRYAIYLFEDFPLPFSISAGDGFTTAADADASSVHTAGQTPSISINYGSIGTFYVAVASVDSSANREIEFSSLDGDLQYYTEESSIVDPASHANVFAAGAIDEDNWVNGPQESFSSLGPTNAWGGSASRIKPDIAAPDGVANYTYTAFYGTSAACPHTAGAAALLLEESPTRTADQLMSLLRSRAIDIGAAGTDNVYGAGKLNLVQVTSTPNPSSAAGGLIGRKESGTRACFIATASYGSPLAPEVNTLCRFRDKYLANNYVGRKFISTYYKHSPPIADFIRDKDYLKRLLRLILAPIVRLCGLFV
ncbi:CFI-box-CTERM domain-containing protein [Candidatus Omnitrophota bacterium]